MDHENSKCMIFFPITFCDLDSTKILWSGSRSDQILWSGSGTEQNNVIRIQSKYCDPDPIKILWSGSNQNTVIRIHLSDVLTCFARVSSCQLMWMTPSSRPTDSRYSPVSRMFRGYPVSSIYYLIILHTDLFILHIRGIPRNKVIYYLWVYPVSSISYLRTLYPVNSWDTLYQAYHI